MKTYIEDLLLDEKYNLNLTHTPDLKETFISWKEQNQKINNDL